MNRARLSSIRIIAKGGNGGNGFDVYLDLSGDRLRKYGTISGLKQKKNRAEKLDNSIIHLLRVVQEYIQYELGDDTDYELSKVVNY